MTEDVQCVLYPHVECSWCLATGFSSDFHELLKTAEKEGQPCPKLRAFALERLPLFAEAEQSAREALTSLVSRYVHPRILSFECLRDVPAPDYNKRITQETLLHGLTSDTMTLATYWGVIRDAAKENDESFFIRLANALRDRERARSKKPDPLKIWIAGLWTKHRLWLMSDRVGFLYLQRRLRLPIKSEFAYGKCKQRLKLLQHPKPPLTRITQSGELLGVDRFLKKMSDLK